MMFSPSSSYSPGPTGIFWGCDNMRSNYDGKSGEFSQDWEGKRDDADSGLGRAR